MIFLKISGQIYRMDLPDRSQARQQRDPFDLDQEPLRINIASSDFGLLRYRITLGGPYPQPDDFQALHEFLLDRQINDLTTGGLFETDHPIIIMPTRTTKWAHVIDAFNAVARARYTNVIFAQAQ